MVIVTADHSHTFVLGGYVDRGNPIFGFQSRYEVLSDGKPALSLSYADGPGGLQDGKPRANLTGVNYNATDFKQKSLIYTKSESHSGEDIGK